MSSLRRALIAIGIAGFAAGVGIALLAANSDHLDSRGAAAAVGLLLGWSFIGTGLYAWDRRPENGTGALMVAVGFAWFLSALVTANSELVFTIGLLVNNLFFAVLLHLLLAFPSGRLETRSDKRLAGASYFVAVGLGLPVMLFADTTNDEVCGCPRQPADGAGQLHDAADPRPGPDRPGARSFSWRSAASAFAAGAPPRGSSGPPLRP